MCTEIPTGNQTKGENRMEKNAGKGKEQPGLVVVHEVMQWPEDCWADESEGLSGQTRTVAASRRWHLWAFGTNCSSMCADLHICSWLLIHDLGGAVSHTSVVCFLFDSFNVCLWKSVFLLSEREAERVWNRLSALPWQSPWKIVWIQPAGLCCVAKVLFKLFVQTQKLVQQPACFRKPQDYSARKGAPAYLELCYLIKEEFVRKLWELIRESDSNLTQSLRKRPAVVMS